ncbi:MAG: NAD(P)-dependent oxidoreductase [Oscillospiraceae bacterium]
MREKDWTGNGNSIYKTLGASNHTDEERENDDYYATDAIAINALLDDGGEVFDNNIWECACGRGDLSERLSEYGYNVRSTDLIDRGYGTGCIDFLTYDEQWNGDIITNPPYKYAREFIEHALEIIPEGNKVAMFLKVQFLEGKGRKEMYKKYPPKYVYVSSSRILCAKNAEFEKMRESGGSAVAYAWYVWEKGYSERTTLKWIN